MNAAAVQRWIDAGTLLGVAPLPGREPAPMAELEELCRTVGPGARVWLNPATGRVVVRRQVAGGVGAAEQR